MDGHSRQPRRAIRTIGRLTPMAQEDIVVDQTAAEQQWHIGLSHDLAIAQDWKMETGDSAAARNRIESASALEAAARQYIQHQQAALEQTLRSVEESLVCDRRPRATFDPPQIPLEALLSALTSLEHKGELSIPFASAIRSRCTGLSEYVARVSAQIDLYRHGHISLCDLEWKLQELVDEIEEHGILDFSGTRSVWKRP